MNYIIDDACYYRGKAYNLAIPTRRNRKFSLYEPDEWNYSNIVIEIPYKKYILIYGERAIGKSCLARELSKFDEENYYITVQQPIELPLTLRKEALRELLIREVTTWEVNK